MRDVAGIVLILIGAGFVLAGLRHRRTGPPPSPRLAATGALVRPVAWVILAYTGIKASLAWAALDAGRFFSILDLAGFLVLLLSYGTWLTLRTRPHAAGCATEFERGQGEVEREPVRSRRDGARRRRGDGLSPRGRHGSPHGGIDQSATAVVPGETHQGAFQRPAGANT